MGDNNAIATNETGQCPLPGSLPGMTAIEPATIRLAAIGDLLLTTQPGEHQPGRGLEALSPEIRQIFATCDIVLANLECTLPGKEMVATEPRVFTSEAQICGLAKAGINVVSLANNHAFDAGDEGFGRITALLEKQNIAWFGAGLTLSDAIRPCLMEIRGIRIAIIGAVDESSGIHRFAGPASSGVPSLDCENICSQIVKLRSCADHVIISPHWGHERFRFPSPEQIKQAHEFIGAGASIVMGHHPHVVQGMELYQKCPIAYSLGNFFVNPVYWESGDFLTWNRFERTGCILLVELDKSEIINVRQIPVYDDGEKIIIDVKGPGERYLRSANHMLDREITVSRYRRENFRVHTLLPIISHLRWNKIQRFRPSHIHRLLRFLQNQMRNASS